MACELIIKVYEHGDFQGQYRTIVTDENNFNNIGFNDVVSSLTIEKGCNYDGHSVTFYEDGSYQGRSIGSFAAGTKIANLNDYAFNDVMSSLKITKNE